MMIPADYLPRLYAGWLAKIIGIRLGAPVEGWTYQKIKDIYGEIHSYPVDYREFAADDDSNGPLFFLRALEDMKPGAELTAQDVGDALLNYAPYEHGFFWWGGYGISTEHTAYLNLRNGIRAPQSGSVEQNGAAVAEQIGGQIFIDTWGLVAPGNPELAARYARQAASVTHGGNGVYGGIFVAVCISLAFVERDMGALLSKALRYIPEDCEYARAVRAVMAYHQENPGCWRDCYGYIFENFGYDRYAGGCPIIPNIAVMILSLLYGEGDFEKTLTICAMCGWDTDCNVGNVAAIMGVLVGLEGIGQEWIKPVKDLLICSSAIGSLNIMDVPFGASYIAMLAYRVAGEPLPSPFDQIIPKRIDSCHFEYPKSTHALRVRCERREGSASLEATLMNSDEEAFTGSRSLKMHVMPMNPADRVYLYKKTHYQPKDFHDSRYDPCFSPLLYPGQTVHGSAFIPARSRPAYVRLYAREQRTGQVFFGDRTLLAPGQWREMAFQIPAMEGALLDEAGFCFDMPGENGMRNFDFTAFVDDLYFDGNPEYTIDYGRETTEVWTGNHAEVSQMTRVKGLLYLEDGLLNLSCADFAEAYTGRHDWMDYVADFALTPITGAAHFVNFRVQGALRSYAAGFDGAGKFVLQKNENGYRILAQAPFEWHPGQEYIIQIQALGDEITAKCQNAILHFRDENGPYLRGSVGMSAFRGSRCRYRSIQVGKIPSSH